MKYETMSVLKIKDWLDAKRNKQFISLAINSNKAVEYVKRIMDDTCFRLGSYPSLPGLELNIIHFHENHVHVEISVYNLKEPMSVRKIIPINDLTCFYTEVGLTCIYPPQYMIFEQYDYVQIN